VCVFEMNVASRIKLTKNFKKNTAKENVLENVNIIIRQIAYFLRFVVVNV
jgi:hypothetical protein